MEITAERTTAERRTADLLFSTRHALPAQDSLSQMLLMRVLDEVDYGLLVIDTQGHIRHANHLARQEM